MTRVTQFSPLNILVETGLTDWTRSSERTSRTSSVQETSSSAKLIWSSVLLLFNGLSNLRDLLRGSLLSNLLGGESVVPSSGLKQDLLGGGWIAGVEDVKLPGVEASFAWVDSTQGVLTGVPFLRELVSLSGVAKGQLKVFSWIWTLASNELGFSKMLSREALAVASSVIFREKRLWKVCERWDGSAAWNSEWSSVATWGGNEDKMAEGVSLEYLLCSMWLNGGGSGSWGISSPWFKSKKF